MNEKVLVVGGGISGVIAAIEISRRGRDVTILEKKDRMLKKMLVTGNGRCNLTNTVLSSDNYNSPDFVSHGIEKFNNDSFLEFLYTLGVLTTVENGRIYPISLKASNVVNALLDEVKNLGIEVINSSPVLSIKKDGDEFIVYTNEYEYRAGYIVYACGGCSLPSSGSERKDFEILKSLGHHVTDLEPALTQIELDSKFLSHLKGTKIVGEISLYDDEKIISSSGEILFTEYGISGPPVLDISKYVHGLKNPIVKFSLINHLEQYSNLREELYNLRYIGDRSLEEFLLGIVDKKFVHYITKKFSLSKDEPIMYMDENVFTKILDELMECEFVVRGTRGFESSQVTSGGVSLDEVDSVNMRSKIVDNLFIIGETLDIDGDCGGYNIQWAFTSAMLAASIF